MSEFRDWWNGGGSVKWAGALDADGGTLSALEMVFYAGRRSKNQIMEGLTPKQKEVLNWIRCFIEDNTYSPTRAEIAGAFGVYPNAAQDHIKALEKKGAISYRRHIPRSIVINT